MNTTKRESTTMYFFFGIFFLVALVCLLWNHHRKACIIKKVCTMTQAEKYRLLNELTKPLGYHYFPCQDIFLSTLDAWQREFGYTHKFDCLAPHFNMVFDSQPVYFDYDGRTWLIELWKGQYGINTGAEIGIYCADGIVPPEKRGSEYFHTVPDDMLPLFFMNLNRTVRQDTENIANVSMSHWWLAAFRMDCFSQPRDLCADFCIDFVDRNMMCAFADALIALGYNPCCLQISGSCISFCYQAPLTPIFCGCFHKIVCCFAQWKNRLFCKLYEFVTRPFHCTVDRLLYLYFYLPLIFRRCLRLRRYKKRCRKHKCRKKCNH